MFQPKSLRCFGSCDWGFNAPGCFLLWLVLPDGHYHIWREIKFQHTPVYEVGGDIKKRLKELGLKLDYLVADPETMRSMVEVHFPNLKGRLVGEALKVFYDVREVPGIKKKPSTSELLDWIKLLLSEDISPETLRESDPRKLIPPLHGALLKNEQDVHLFERLAFIARRQGAQ